MFGNWFARGPLVPVLRLSGVIGAVMPLRQGLMLASVAAAIERAFGMSGAQAVAVQINSPGGSAVQSRLIYERIRALAKEKSLPVYVFAEDAAASGGYMLALAGDEVYADASSIIGSIGVLYSGFGFAELIGKLGVERRLHTAGERKRMLDPFEPERPDDVARLKRLQDVIHQEFIGLVRERRGKKIEAAGDSLFTGEFWTGKQALDLGLIDGIIDLRTKMRQVYGEKVRLKMVPLERGFFRRKPRVGGSALGLRGLEIASFAEEIISAMEARTLWARLGL